MSKSHTTEYVKYLNSPAWKAFRKHALEHAGYRCQRCGKPRLPSRLQVHHVHYDSLGQERLTDVRVLCMEECHGIEDKEREQETTSKIWEARVDGWARKVYGEYWEEQHDWEDIAREFEDWLDRRGED